MGVTLRTKTVFHCKCERPECGYEWDADTKPKRCARCKFRGWSGEDIRYRDPYLNVPRAAQIRYGTAAPQPPNQQGILRALIKVRAIIDKLITDNPCDHKQGQCVCDETATLAEVDRQIDKLRAMQPKRSTYLVKRGRRKPAGERT